MNEPHVIRLRGPWDAEPVEGSNTVRWTRRFGRPTGLENGAQVWLCLEARDSVQSWRLNDSEGFPFEASHAVQRCDITAQLQTRNRLEVVVEGIAEQSGELTPFDAWLEIVAAGR